jgi:hypothetical protein
LKKAEELAIGAETRVTAPRTNSTEGVKLVLPAPDAFVDWDPRLPPPGNIVERQYKGRMIRVIVLQEGFEYEGRRYKSLTVIAKEFIRPGDMADNILDRNRHPEWNGESTKMVYAFPKNELLWERYAEIRAEGMRGGDGGEAATEFYRQNQAAMDEGAVGDRQW